MIFLIKIYFQKTYTYYINLVDAIIEHQKLRQTCTSTVHQQWLFHIMYKFDLLTSGVIFTVNRYKYFMENKIRTIYGCKPKKIGVYSYQNFTGSYKKFLEALDEVKHTQGIKR